ERDPGAAVDQPTGVQVARVDDDPPGRAIVGDLERLHPQIGREAAGDPGAKRLRRDLGIAAGHGGAEYLWLPLERGAAEVAEGLVALADRLPPSSLGRPALERVALGRVTGDAVEEGAE